MTVTNPKQDRLPPEHHAAVALPASAETPDEALVARAAQDIRNILKSTVARGTEEVGQYLLREFFNDDPSLYTSTRHSKHASLRLLEERCESLDLPVRRSFLGNALQLAVATRRLPKDSAFHLLPASHRVELLRVKTPEKIEVLARSAVEAKMTVQKVRSVVRKEKAKSKSNRGRKPIPDLIKCINASVENLRDQRTGRLRFHSDDLDDLSENQLSTAQDMAATLSKRVDELLALLRC